jgi:oligopeptide/dipeptide ABC transporter ATP-binding protein
MSPLLEVRGLEVRYRARSGKGQVYAVNGVDLAIEAGETLGLVGESGCGKSTLGRAILALTPATAGSVQFRGAEILAKNGASADYRRKAQMVFQDPFAALNPRMTVFETLAEVLKVHRLAEPAAMPAKVLDLMAQAGLSPELAHRKARTLSGGQCQRVGIARALAVGAELIIADEPVSALDVSIQAQILNLFSRLQQERKLAILFISHDLGVVRYLCRRVAVMYLGRIIEQGSAEAVFAAPLHPYTQSLAAAIPKMEADATVSGAPLGGEPPSPQNIPAGCPFHPRCPKAMDICRVGAPPPAYEVEGRRVWCHLYASNGVKSREVQGAA